MNISKILNFGSKDYIIGCENGRATTKRLNVFERIVLRCFLGYYPETHLEKAVSVISSKITQQDFTFAEGEAFKMMDLFNKTIEARSESFGDRTLVSHKLTNAQGQSLTCKLGYCFNRSHRWKLSVGIEDGSGIIRPAEVIFKINSFQVLEAYDISHSALCSEDLLNTLRQNLKEFLLHTLKFSSQLKGIQLNPDQQDFLGFSESFIHKNAALNPAGFGQLPPLSLDFIIQASQ